MDISCQHKTGNGYHYKLNKDKTLWLCIKCEINLRKKILEQIKVEKELCNTINKYILII